MIEKGPWQSFVDKILEENMEEMTKSYWDMLNFGTSVTRINEEGKLVRVDPRTVKLEDL